MLYTDIFILVQQFNNKQNGYIHLYINTWTHFNRIGVEILFFKAMEVYFIVRSVVKEINTNTLRHPNVF